MTIILVAQGSLPIPPVGWGAVEHILWEYTKRLRARGHEVIIVNRKWRLASLQVAWICRTRKVDVVHVHQERALRWIVPLVGQSSLVVGTTHAPLDREDDPEPIRDLARANHLLVLHKGVLDLMSKANPKARIEILANGAETDEFRFAETGNGKAICLGKLQSRKRQRELAARVAGTDVACDFIGPVGDQDLDPETRHMKKGEWDRATILDRLTEYSALVLVSHAEGQPLVVAEALSAGLSVVVSPDAAQNLDLSQPFIHVTHDPTEWTNAISQAISANSGLRLKARDYAQTHFSFDSLVTRYLDVLSQWLGEAKSRKVN